MILSGKYGYYWRLRGYWQPDQSSDGNFGRLRFQM